MRARHRVSKLLLRHGIVYDATAWTSRHLRWLGGRRLDHIGSAAQAALESDLDAVLGVTGRRARLDAAIAEMARDSEFTAMTRRLGCLRGISTLTGFALAVEIGAVTGSGGDWSRFSGNSIGAFVGLVPTEESSGASRGLGGITKTGNAHARRLLVEAAWHHQPRYKPGPTMLRRWALASPAARARGDAGNRRLHRQWETVHRQEQAFHHRHGRGRSRARRLVLVFGGPRRLAPTIRPTPLGEQGDRRLGDHGMPPREERPAIQP